MYLNDHEPYVAAWLRNLYPGATVDERSIVAVQPSDLSGHVRCHFFAGVGGWQYALELAGWPDDEPIWTASLPCQPFSVGGRHDGLLDERHLWPTFHRLVAECRPPVIFGEQVASPAGREWLAGIRHDLETLGYAFGAADICAAALDAPHVRYRLYWVAALPNAARIGWARSGQSPQRWEMEEFERLVQDQLQLSVPAGRSGALADGVSARASKLRAYGNALVPQVAAEFIAAYMEVTR